MDIVYAVKKGNFELRKAGVPIKLRYYPVVYITGLIIQAIQDNKYYLLFCPSLISPYIDIETERPFILYV